MKFWKWGVLLIVVAVGSVFLMWRFMSTGEEAAQDNRAELKPVQAPIASVAASEAEIPEHFITQADVPFPPVFDHQRGLLVDGQYFKPREDVAKYIEKEYSDIPTRKAMLQFAAAFEASMALGGTEEGAAKANISEYDALGCVFEKIPDLKKSMPLIKELEARMLNSPEKLIAYGNMLDNSGGLVLTERKESSCVQ
ncbi:hypothetical protein [Paraburkholderia bonniea]|uniref:hypothetical protein n=1 Tax=Paraburkholderia bonniea TaxID=2152891 RepID=UPI0012916F02|nr:hypothetical protein [Paraburkholderia bonniea]